MEPEPVITAVVAAITQLSQKLELNLRHLRTTPAQVDIVDVFLDRNRMLSFCCVCGAVEVRITDPLTSSYGVLTATVSMADPNLFGSLKKLLRDYRRQK